MHKNKLDVEKHRSNEESCFIYSGREACGTRSDVSQIRLCRMLSVCRSHPCLHIGIRKSILHFQSSDFFTACKPTFVSAAVAAIFVLTFQPAPCRAALSAAASAGTLDFGAITVSDLAAGFKEIDPSPLYHALKVSVADTEPVNWVLKIRAAYPVFSTVAGDKPCDDFGWRINGTGFYTPLNTADDTVTSGTGNADVELDFRMRVGWNDAPGDYKLTIVFTIAEEI